VRSKDSDGLPGLNQQGLVIFQASKATDYCVKGGPIAGSATGPSIHDQFIGVFCNLGIEIVHQHSERSFLVPALARDSRSAGRFDFLVHFYPAESDSSMMDRTRAA